MREGFAQKPSVDFEVTWAHTGTLIVLRCLFAYAATYNHDILHAMSTSADVDSEYMVADGLIKPYK
jgi:hypothetical protein